LESFVPKVSVIVPIYNVEKYLGRCVDSLRGQTLYEIEILLVDDGSPDSCPAMCDRFAEEDNRIRVIHKQNGGLSDARNVGIDFSTGEYLAFIDSDDWIDADMLELLYTLCRKYDVPLAECSYRNVFSDTIKEETDCTGEVRVEDSLFALESMLDWKYFKPIICNKLYHNDLFKGIRFPKGLYHEDEYTAHKLFWAAKKMVYVDVSKYNYDNSRTSSITSSFSDKKIDGVLAFRERLAFFEEHHIDSLMQKLANGYCWAIFDVLYKCYMNKIKSKKVEMLISVALEDASKMEALSVERHYVEQFDALKKGYRQFVNLRYRKGW